MDAVRTWVEQKQPRLEDRYRIRSLAVDKGTILPLSPESITTGIRSDLSPASWNRIVSLVGAIHKVCGQECPSVEMKKAPRGRTRFLTAQEWARLRRALATESPLLEQCASFAIATGLRENNVLELEWAQVDLKRRTAFLYADQMKNRANLGIPLNDAAMAVLLSRRGLHKQFVFAHPDSGKPLVKASNRAWYKAVKKAKLTGFRWHDLRHTWASWAAMSGVSLRELMELGGWKTLSMVQRYSHLAPDHLRAAADRVKPV